jgi:exopolyphosphatase/guanosine-5'-triphosphate,3'-diphosphate pyrophosphatase
MKNDIRASIDIGSNSVLLLVADVTNKKFEELTKQSYITQLGRDLDRTKNFHVESMAATYEALKAYAEEADRFGVPREQVIVTATEAARVAQNAGEFFSKVKQELGLSTTILSSQGEAFYSTQGILFNSKFSDEIITIMDIGGASTELIKVNTKSLQILETISMPVGAVRASQWLEDGLFVQNLQKVFTDFRNEIDKFQSKLLFCVAGTVTSLGNMHLLRKEFIEDDVHGLTLKAEDVDALFKKYSDWQADQFSAEFPSSRSVPIASEVVCTLFTT